MRRGLPRALLAAMLLLIATACQSSPSSEARGKNPLARHAAERNESGCTGAAMPASGLIQGHHRSNPPPVPKPAKGEGFIDPVHGTCIVRVTDHENEPPKGFARNDYSRRQPFNADGSLLLVAAQDGYWHLYDAETLEHIRKLQLGGGSVEPHWHPTKPNLLFTIANNGGMSLYVFDVTTGRHAEVVDFTDDMPIAGYPEADTLRDIWPDVARLLTRSEGSPSMDARYWAFQAETQDFQPLGLVTFDLKERRITGVYDFKRDGGGIGRPDHVSMSPRGNHVVASWNGKEVSCPNRLMLGTLDDPCGLMIFSRDFTEARGVAVRGPHSDMAIDVNGDEVIVISNYVTGNVEMIRLADGKKTPLWPLYEKGRSVAMHISGKAYDRPGWVLVSTYALHGRGDHRPWFTDKIVAVELSEDPRVFNIASTYNKGANYFSEPHAVVNRDFTKIVFNSNWGTGDAQDVDVYLVELPANALPRS